MNVDAEYNELKFENSKLEYDIIIFLKNVQASGEEDVEKLTFNSNAQYSIFKNCSVDEIESDNLVMFSFKTPLGYKSILPNNNPLESFQDSVMISEITLKDEMGYLKKLVIFGEDHTVNKLCSDPKRATNVLKSDIKEKERIDTGNLYKSIFDNHYYRKLKKVKPVEKNEFASTFEDFFNHLLNDSNIPVDFWLENVDVGYWNINPRKELQPQYLFNKPRKDGDSTTTYSTRVFNQLRETGYYKEYHRFHWIDFRRAVINFGHHKYGIDTNSRDPETGDIVLDDLDVIKSNFAKYLLNTYPPNCDGHIGLFERFAGLIIDNAIKYSKLNLKSKSNDYHELFQDYFDSEIWFEFMEMTSSIQFEKKSLYRWLKSLIALWKQDYKKTQIIFLFFGLLFLDNYTDFIDKFTTGLLDKDDKDRERNSYIAFVEGGFLEAHFLLRYFRKWSKLKEEQMDIAQFSLMFVGDHHNFNIYNFFRNVFAKFWPKEYISCKNTHFSELCKQHFLTDELLIPDKAKVGYVFL